MNSLTKPFWYKEMLKTRIAFSVKFYFVLVFIMALGSTTIAAFDVIPQTKRGTSSLLGITEGIYPSDLVFELKSGVWNINLQEPFTLPFKQWNVGGTPKNFIVFNHSGTIDDLDIFDTLILINETNVLVKPNTPNIQTIPVSNLGDMLRSRGPSPKINSSCYLIPWNWTPR